MFEMERQEKLIIHRTMKSEIIKKRDGYVVVFYGLCKFLFTRIERKYFNTGFFPKNSRNPRQLVCWIRDNPIKEDRKRFLFFFSTYRMWFEETWMISWHLHCWKVRVELFTNESLFNLAYSYIQIDSSMKLTNEDVLLLILILKDERGCNQDR